MRPSPVSAQAFRKRADNSRHPLQGAGGAPRGRSAARALRPRRRVRCRSPPGYSRCPGEEGAIRFPDLELASERAAGSIQRQSRLILRWAVGSQVSTAQPSHDSQADALGGRRGCRTAPFENRCATAAHLVIVLVVRHMRLPLLRRSGSVDDRNALASRSSRPGSPSLLAPSEADRPPSEPSLTTRGIWIVSG
jgi:hypothetical protein